MYYKYPSLKYIFIYFVPDIVNCSDDSEHGSFGLFDTNIELNVDNYNKTKKGKQVCKLAAPSFFKESGINWEHHDIIKADRDDFVDMYKCENDEARSMFLCCIKKGTRISLYDDPNLRTDDDWVEITIEEDMKDQCLLIPSFQYTGTISSKISMDYHSVSDEDDINALDGKVSSFLIETDLNSKFL